MRHVQVWTEELSGEPVNEPIMSNPYGWTDCAIVSMSKEFTSIVTSGVTYTVRSAYVRVSGWRECGGWVSVRRYRQLREHTCSPACSDVYRVRKALAKTECL